MKVFFILLTFSAILLALPGESFSQSASKLIRNGNKQYEQGKYSEAEKNYRRSLELDNKSVKGKFNLGDAVYKQKNFNESAKIFNDLTSSKLSKPEKAQVYHNLGNSLLEAKEYEKSIAAYKNSLVLNPSDKDTKYNLEYAKMMLKQQQQQQQQQQQNQDKKDQEKKDDKKQDQQQNQQDKEQKQDKQNKSQEDKKISKEDAERMLEALKNDEKKTMQKVEKKRVQANQVIIEKDW